MYTCGRHTASTSSPATACHAPTSRPASPPNDSTAHPPSTAGMTSAPPRPPSHAPPASTSGSPGTNDGVMKLPDAENPVVAKSSPPAPPNAPAAAGTRTVPCPAIQYPYCRYTPGSPATNTCPDRSSACHTPNPAAIAIIASTAPPGTSARARAPPAPEASASAGPNRGHRAGSRRIAK